MMSWYIFLSKFQAWEYNNLRLNNEISLKMTVIHLSLDIVTQLQKLTPSWKYKIFCIFYGSKGLFFAKE